jgi:hypothetical protein
LLPLMTSTEDPCLPTHQPDSSAGTYRDDPGRLNWTSALACCSGWPTCQTRATTEAGSTAWSACSPWRPLRSWLAQGRYRDRQAGRRPAQPMLTALGARRDPLTGCDSWFVGLGLGPLDDLIVLVVI